MKLVYPKFLPRMGFCEMTQEEVKKLDLDPLWVWQGFCFEWFDWSIIVFCRPVRARYGGRSG